MLKLSNKVGCRLYGCGLWLFLIFLLSLSARPGQLGAQTNIQGYNAQFEVVFDDSLAAAITKVIKPSTAHRGWFRIDQYKFFSGWVTFDTTGFGAGIGFTSADTVKILMEQYADDDVPASSATGFYELEAVGTVPTREQVAIYDSTLIIDNLKTFVSFHGTGDPEIAPGTWVRFYTKVVGGFTSGGLGLKLGFFKQP
jgi:hypothetical protein